MKGDNTSIFRQRNQTLLSMLLIEIIAIILGAVLGTYLGK